jgi:threonyl-tRNA synthetase
MEINDLYKVRHSTAHLLAQAVTELFPGTIVTIGPVTDEGFFYDFLPPEGKSFKNEDLPKIENRMKKIISEDIPLIQKDVTKEDALKLFKDNPFKLELIKNITDKTVGLTVQGSFTDLCKGNHVKSTGKLKHFKLLGISGSYWRADRAGQALQRISGTAFPSEKELKEYEAKKEEAEKYDHRKLGKEMDIFSIHEEGPGFPFFHPKGTTILQVMTNYIRKELDKEGYKEIKTPIILSEKLWHQSGHYSHYKPNMYFLSIDEQPYAVKPMNCPGCILIYKSRPHSYRELPLKLSEFGLVHRHELSGVLHGLFRVRNFTQDDAHVFCMPDQIEQEILNIINFVKRTYATFGFENVEFLLSTKPEKAMGDDALWDKATNALKAALEDAKITYDVDEGGGAFYGPKIDVKVKDSMGRLWQLGTIQVDFFMPQNFDISYISPEGKKERPIMIHRAIYGSFERFLGILLEHYKGKLPFWIAPVQIKVLTISDDQLPYAQEITQKLKDQGLRVELMESSDPLQAKIKTAQLERIPWMLVLGNKEVQNNTITLRQRDGKQEFGLSFEELLKKAQTLTKR